MFAQTFWILIPEQEQDGYHKELIKSARMSETERDGAFYMVFVFWSFSYAFRISCFNFSIRLVVGSRSGIVVQGYNKKGLFPSKML